MLLRKWEELPPKMQCDEVKKYYDNLTRHTADLIIKRVFDIVASLLLIILLLPLFLILSLIIVIDSQDGVFFCQTRVTAYGKRFRIIKFRTMVRNAENMGAAVTVNNDMRVTRVGKVLRRYRLDELPQLFNIFVGDMTFVGTRPEIEKYVDEYTPEMLATLLLPAGVTSEASIYYKDENELINSAEDADDVYINDVLPGKMFYNLRGIYNFSLQQELKTMVRTVLVVLGKEYPDERMKNNKDSVLTEEEVVHK